MFSSRSGSVYIIAVNILLQEHLIDQQMFSVRMQDAGVATTDMPTLVDTALSGAAAKLQQVRQLGKDKSVITR